MPRRKARSGTRFLWRIYGTAWATKEELEAHLKMLEEAEKRDHRKLGKELDIFSMHDEGPGFPFFHPNGMRIRNAILEYWHQVHRKYHYEQVMTPMILNRELWIRSGLPSPSFYPQHYKCFSPPSSVWHWA